MSKLDSVADWINLAQLASYSANRLAEICLISESQLHRFFASRFGKSPQRWLDELRFWQAAELICSGLQGKEVAHRLHFSSQTVFCRAFKIFHGVSPLRYAANQYFHVGLRYLSNEVLSKRRSTGITIPWELAIKQLLARPEAQNTCHDKQRLPAHTMQA